MKKTGLLKILVVAVVSAVLVVNLGAVVLADNTYDEWDTPADTGNTEVGNNEAENIDNFFTDGNTSANDFENAIEGNNEAFNEDISTNTGTATTDLNTSDYEENNDVNSLAYTGIEDNSILAIAIVLGVLMAIYSFKKVKEYSNV